MATKIKTDGAIIPLFRGRPSDSGPWARVVAAVLRRPVMAFVLSAQGQTILAKYGFLPLS